MWKTLLFLFAAFLVCDPYPYAGSTAVPVDFELFFDGATTPIISPAVSNALHYDLSSLSNGTHSVIVKARGLWGESVGSSPFAFEKQVPPGPQNIKLSSN